MDDDAQRAVDDDAQQPVPVTGSGGIMITKPGAGDGE